MSASEASNKPGTLKATKKPCTACMSVPPIVGPEYNDQGNWDEINGVKSYVVSILPFPKTGILAIYDIFGYSSQARQGADILAAVKPGHVVVMPDFFGDSAMDPSLYAEPETEEKKKAKGEFFKPGGPADIQMSVDKVFNVLKGLQASETYKSVERWGILGFCWGGKVATKAAIREKDAFYACAQVHPAFLDFEDVKQLTIAHCLLASKGEDRDTVNKIAEYLKAKDDESKVEIYSENIHGWMGARANLEDGDERLAYEEGYKDLVRFFAKADDDFCAT